MKTKFAIVDIKRKTIDLLKIHIYSETKLFVNSSHCQVKKRFFNKSIVLRLKLLRVIEKDKIL